MSDMYASPVNTPQQETATRKILVWDLPVRVFHWLMVFCFAGAYLTAESEHWRLVHVSLGYTLAGLVAFRLIWGVIGSKHARFASFVRGPKAVMQYLSSLLRGQPAHHTGHNPAGALAIIAMLLLSLAVVATGWANYSDFGGEWLEEAHELSANLMLATVIVHVAAVLLSSLLHRENLVGAMLTGRKRGESSQDIKRSAWHVAVLILLAVCTFWWMQWHNAPQAPLESAVHSAKAERQHDDD